MIQNLADNFAKSLLLLRKEVEAYQDETVLWQKTGQVNNSAGTLSLHLVGNLNHFIGATLGNTGFVRDRHAEFHDVDVPRAEILSRIDDTISMIKEVLPKLTMSQWEEEFPLQVFGHPMGTGYFLFHLLGHLNYHLGQISYHRRILDN